MKHGPHNKQRTIIVQLVPVYKKKNNTAFYIMYNKNNNMQ